MVKENLLEGWLQFAKQWWKWSFYRCRCLGYNGDQKEQALARKKKYESTWWNCTNLSKNRCVSELAGGYQLLSSQALWYIYGTTVEEPWKEAFTDLIPWLSLYSRNQKGGIPNRAPKREEGCILITFIYDHCRFSFFWQTVWDHNLQHIHFGDKASLQRRLMGTLRPTELVTVLWGTVVKELMAHADKFTPV